MNEHSQSGQALNANYHAYLLRLWRESPTGQWRAWLQDAATGERHGFAGLATLLRFLCAQTGECALLANEPTPPIALEEEEDNHVWAAIIRSGPQPGLVVPRVASDSLASRIGSATQQVLCDPYSGLAS